MTDQLLEQTNSTCRHALFTTWAFAAHAFCSSAPWQWNSLSASALGWWLLSDWGAFLKLTCTLLQHSTSITWPLATAVSLTYLADLRCLTNYVIIIITVTNFSVNLITVGCW